MNKSSPHCCNHSPNKGLGKTRNGGNGILHIGISTDININNNIINN